MLHSVILILLMMQLSIIMSIGKYNESQILMGYDDTITIEDCHNMSIHEIHNEIAKHHSESNSHHGKHHE